MPNQEESKDGFARKDADRPAPDVDRVATDGQSGNRATVGPPREILSDRNGPSDPDNRKN